MGESRHQSHPSHTLDGRDAQSARLSRARRLQSVEIDHQERTKGRRRLLYGTN